MIAAFCALLSGAAFYFSIQIGSIWPLAWVAPIPLWWLTYGKTPGWQVLLACWSAYTIGMCNMLPAYLGHLPSQILVVAIVLPGLIFGAVALVARFVSQRLTPLAGPMVSAALWTAVEYALSFGPNGTASSWAYSQVGAPALIQSASVFGLWIITFALVFFSSAIALAIARRQATPAIAAVLFFAANAGYGCARLYTAHSGELVRVGLAADDRFPFPVNEQAEADKAVNSYGNEVRLLAEDGVRLVVFPEKIAALSPAWRAAVIAKLGQAARETNTTVVMGFDDRAAGMRRNNALVFTPADTAPREYDKRHLVPGLEDPFEPGIDGFILPDGTGVAICKDMDFPVTLRADAAGHLTLMAVPAWDFHGDRWWHARLAIMRSVENGFSLARAAKEGLLTLSDAYGRVVAEKPTTYEGMVCLVGEVPRGPATTLYQHLGDVFAWAAMALGVLLPSAAMIRRPR